MKSILLTTTALVAFAGAAVADGHTSITFKGNTEFGYNDWDGGSNVIVDDEQGFYWNTDIDVTMSATLDNGLTASTSFEIDVVGDPANSMALSSDEWVASLESANAGIFIGDTAFAAESHWASAGDMESDGFSEADGETAIRADVSVAGVSASVSYVLANNAQELVLDDTGEDVTQLSVGASGDFGMFSFAVAYQEENDFTGYFNGVSPSGDSDNGDFNDNEIFGISAGFAVAGADITVAYASDETLDENSTGIKVAYPFGPVTATAYYVSEDDAAGEDNFGLKVAYADGPIKVTADYQDDQGVEKWGLEGSYDTGANVVLYAGILNENEGTDDDYYVAGVYDLGGGASVLVSYAEDDDGDQEDEVGAKEYDAGTSVVVSFKF